ncbi:cytochrome c oxidase subunit 3 [Rapidithrix thailandica]|uniref:Cytochrome c oxidase subunit 3 n=1 Tax=Rapidithrix thailandica TaxID=413964 RepID=A0AAW9RWJ9_9BACT
MSNSMAKQFDNSMMKEGTRRMHPKKFGLWLFMASVVMMFGGFTSAYIVRQAEGNWLIFELPTLFYYSTVVILLSSITMHIALHYAKQDKLDLLKIFITVTSLLGVAFLILQVQGWKELMAVDINFGGENANPSGSFLYVLTGVHGAHILSGLIVLAFTLIAVFQYKVHSKRLTRIQMCATYWHFLDFLWIYLFIFLLLNR